MPKHITMIALAIACLALTIALWRASPNQPAPERLPAAPADDPAAKVEGSPAAGELVTEYLNIRELAEKLRPKGYVPSVGVEVTYPQTEEETCEEIAKFISQRVATDSWKDAGGASGEFQQIAGIMIVTQTPENIRSIHTLLRRLEAATGDRNWLAGAQRQQAAAPIDSQKGADGASTQPVRLETGYFNIRRLVDEIRSAPPTRFGQEDTNFEVMSKIGEVMTTAVAPDSWQDNGGKSGSMFFLGEVLVITQTPENLKACREVLVNLHLTGSGDVGAAPATTRSSNAP